MSESNTKILVVGPSWVGDMVMAQSLFMVLCEQFPNCEIDVMSPGWSLPLLARMPEVRDGLEMPLGHGQLQLGLRRKLGKSLIEKHYDRVYVLPNSLKSALIPFWAKIPMRTGYVGELRWGLLNDARKLDKKALTKTVQRFVALALEKTSTPPQTWPYPKLTVNDDDVTDALNRMGLNRDKPVLALCPGAEYGPAKRWPEKHNAAVAKVMRDKGWQVWIFGSEKDQPVGEAIQHMVGEGCVDLTGKTSLADAIDLMSLSKIVISNDSGLMHVAAALGCKVIAIYGSSDPGFTPPLHDQAEILTLNLDCSPCFKRECPLGHLNCLNDLSPERVLDILETI
jgi:heptosyltransferase II